MKLTREEAIKRHRELWGWLAENPLKEKKDWPGWEKYGGAQYDCFCCEFAGRAEGFENCKNCPLEWPALRTNSCKTPCGNSYFDNWQHTAKPEERSKFAALIRDLPAKEDRPALKVGDWARIKSDITPRRWYNNTWFNPEMNQYCGKVYEIVSCPTKSKYYLKDLKQSDSVLYWEWDISMLELAEPPAPRFTIGDKVVPISKSIGVAAFGNEENWEKSKERGYFFINSLFKEKGKQAYACGSDLNSGGNYYLESDLIPYVEPKPEPRAFKVGDIIHGISDNRYSVTNINMTKGKVTRVMDGNYIEVVVLEYKDNFWINHSFRVEGKYFELVTAPSNLCPTPKTERYIFNGPATVCIIEQDGKQYKGVVKCYYKDTWSEQIGRQEAYKKALEQMNQ